MRNLSWLCCHMLKKQRCSKRDLKRFLFSWATLFLVEANLYTLLSPKTSAPALHKVYFVFTRASRQTCFSHNYFTVLFANWISNTWMKSWTRFFCCFFWHVGRHEKISFHKIVVLYVHWASLLWMFARWNFDTMMKCKNNQENVGSWGLKIECWKFDNAPVKKNVDHKVGDGSAKFPFSACLLIISI